MHADKVVCVHNSMDETIKGNGKINITIVKDISVEPVKQKDGSMMVNVKKRKLSPLLSQNDKDGIPKIPNF
jgi:hypothetical protein